MDFDAVYRGRVFFGLNLTLNLKNRCGYGFLYKSILLEGNTARGGLIDLRNEYAAVVEPEIDSLLVECHRSRSHAGFDRFRH